MVLKIVLRVRALMVILRIIIMLQCFSYQDISLARVKIEEVKAELVSEIFKFLVDTRDEQNSQDN